MQKAICILFLGVYLFSSTELRQLLKFPLLIQHYIEHKEQDKNITVWKFLSIHYEEATVIDIDYDKDQQLPFKSHDGCAGSGLGSFMPTAFYSLVEKTCKEESVTYIISNEYLISSVYLSSIWQPPKA
ncbi:MAG: hypothetical protein IPK31_17475 [Chitinophagaceae bacterium]|nr:hypothetical protein [Chitinophagaceae bacterium]